MWVGSGRVSRWPVLTFFFNSRVISGRIRSSIRLTAAVIFFGPCVFLGPVGYRVDSCWYIFGSWVISGQVGVSGWRSLVYSYVIWFRVGLGFRLFGSSRVRITWFSDHFGFWLIRVQVTDSGHQIYGSSRFRVIRIRVSLTFHKTQAGSGSDQSGLHVFFRLGQILPPLRIIASIHRKTHCNLHANILAFKYAGN